METPKGVYIDGGWTPSEGDEQTNLINPATERVLGEIPRGSARDVGRAVDAAKQAFEFGPWPRMSLGDRWSILRRAQELFQEAAEDLAQIQTAQMGAPIATSRGLVGATTSSFEIYHQAAQRTAFSFLRRDSSGQSLVRRLPVGVVAAITPWNGPVSQAAGKVIPALLAGCTVVVKPAEETPVETGRLAEIFSSAGLPDGVLNVVFGGRETGEALVAHPDVAKVSFTGSSATGARIAEVAARTLKRVSLELGGKSAAVVLDDVNLEEAAPLIAAGNFANAGQSCIALTRVLVPRGRHNEIVEALIDEASKWILGDPLDPSTTMGPLVSERQRQRVESFIEKGLADGAALACGGGRPEGLTRGYYVKPTILVGVRNEMEIAQEEVFGPVMSVIPYDSEDEAIRIANDTRYGLHGGVFTSDPRHGLEIADRVQSGGVAINHFGLTRTAPFGGVKASGIARERWIEGLGNFLEYKSTLVPDNLAMQLEQSGIPFG